jgi:hypothetical protein
MRNRRLALLLTVLLVAVLLLTACGPRPEQGDLASGATETELVVDLPALYIDYDDQGAASLSGTALSVIGAALGQDLSVLDRSAAEMAALQAAGVQHALVNLTPAGLQIAANGMPLVTLEWDETSLGSLGGLLAAMDDPALAPAANLLPLAQDMSVGIVMRFPGAESAEALPLLTSETVDMRALNREQQQQLPTILTELGVPPIAAAVLPGLPALTITYAADGTAALTGLPALIATQIPASALTGLNLQPDQLEMVAGLGLETVNIKNSEEGLAITVNGNPLPFLRWNGGEMQNLGALGIDGGVLAAVAGLDAATLDTISQVVKLTPILQASKLDITINFPQ